MIVEWDEYKNIVEKLAIEIHQNYKPTVLVGIITIFSTHLIG